MALGMSLDEVVAATTVRAAASLGRPEVTGTLAVGGPADIAVLEQVPGTVELEDTKGERVTVDSVLRARATIRAGRVAWSAA
jgi:dihydroorotase